MTEKLREIQVFSNAENTELFHTKKYWFHHWLSKTKALIEDEKGELLEVSYKHNFRFKTASDEQAQN